MILANFVKFRCQVATMAVEYKESVSADFLIICSRYKDLSKLPQANIVISPPIWRQFNTPGAWQVVFAEPSFYIDTFPLNIIVVGEVDYCHPLALAWLYEMRLTRHVSYRHDLCSGNDTHCRAQS
jgi:hypothetical protein